MSENAKSWYDAEFYSGQASGSRRSAELVVPEIIDAVRPASVIDVGCGVGTWLSIFKKHGIRKLRGVDGSYVDRNMLQIESHEFAEANLEVDDLTQFGKFDLALSLEVAEHLPPGRSENFVDSLINLSDNILFGAAIPGQGGTNHINERWQSFWCNLFISKGYQIHDIVRHKFWDSPVEPWYAQNSFLFIKSGSVYDSGVRPTALPFDLVHPAFFRSRLNQIERLKAENARIESHKS